MTKYEHKHLVVQFDRPWLVVALMLVGLSAVSYGFAQDDLPAPISPSAGPVISGQSPKANPTQAPNSPPSPLRMQP